jgi:hypothetical protein
LREQDVERILRDVLNTQGLQVSAVRAEATLDGWRVTVTDAGGRLSTDVAAGRPAVVRASRTRWLLTSST